MKIVPTQVTEHSQTWQLWLDGPSDLVSVWDMPPSREDTQQHIRQRLAIDRVPNFYGIREGGEPDARQIVLKGFPAGAELVTEIVKQVTDEMPPPKSRRRSRKWREDGDEASYERIQLGLEPWLSSHRTLKSACGLVEVISCWGEDCGATIDQLKWSGAAALALTDMLERADYSVELALVAAMMDARRNCSLVRVDLKRMGELLDVEKLAGVAVYPPAWRLYGLCAFQKGPFSSGIGYDSHPHSHATIHEPNGMWNYRPNVMTVTLGTSVDLESAKRNVLESLKMLESLVNPQEIQE